jgi:hypothetical protein
VTALAILGAGLLIAGSIIAHALLRGRTQPPAADPEPAGDPDATQELPFNLVPLAVLAPDDPRLPDDDAAAIAAAIADAVDDYASYLVAVDAGLDPQTVEMHREHMYDRLRESLTPPQMARALLTGIRPHARERADALTAQFRDLPSTQES